MHKAGTFKYKYTTSFWSSNQKYGIEYLGNLAIDPWRKIGRSFLYDKVQNVASTFKYKYTALL